MAKGGRGKKAASDDSALESPEFQKFFKANPVWAGYRLPDYISQ